MSTTRAKVKQAADDLMDGADIETRFEKAKSEFYKIAASLAESGSSKAREYTDMAANAASDVKDEVKAVSGDAIDQFMDQLAMIERDMKGKVRQKPLQALAIAGGIGFMIALLSRR